MFFCFLRFLSSLNIGHSGLFQDSLVLNVYCLVLLLLYDYLPAHVQWGLQHQNVEVYVRSAHCETFSLLVWELTACAIYLDIFA